MAADASQPGSQNDKWVQQELVRRQLLAQLEANQAAKETAEHTKRSATYMLWSVIVLAAAFAQLVVTYLKP